MDFASESLRPLAGKVYNVTGTQNHPTALYLALLMAGLGDKPNQVAVREDTVDEGVVQWLVWATNDSTLFAGRCEMTGDQASDVEVATMRLDEIVGVQVADVVLQDSFSSSERIAIGSWTFRDRSGATIRLVGEDNRLRNELVEAIAASLIARI